MNIHHWHTTEQPPYVPDQVSRVVVWDEGAPPDPNAVSTVDKHGWQHGAVPLRLNGEALFIEILQHGVVIRVKDRPCGRLQPRVNVTRRSMVLAALEPRAELSRGHEEVHVVGADKVLREVHDRVLEGRLPMVVRGLLRDVPHELSNLDVVLELLLEGAEEHLALRRLEAVDHRGHRTQDVVLGKLHQLLVDEVGVANVVLRMVYKGALLI
mmetsp:Transcript_40081/g.111411  ORF Transcript_40081/g.111411 Transcript_40081/m.111411 type:complete len:211 (-) Transcript_40081:955-1587(-)